MILIIPKDFCKVYRARADAVECDVMCSFRMRRENEWLMFDPGNFFVSIAHSKQDGQEAVAAAAAAVVPKDELSPKN